MKETEVESLHHGNHEAFENVFITCFPKVKSFIRGIIRSEADAEDLAQDVFIKLWVNRTTLNPEKPLGPYLYTMARNSALNFLKHKLIEDTFIDSFSNFNPVTDSSDEILFAKEIQLLIEMTICKMPVQRKRIYQMSRDNRLSNNEIAQELNISKKTVENQLSLALQEIRQVISSFLIFFL
ncbi:MULTISPECIES: RNA polymerase sigma-70 factor [unclassified Butyricimonas]|uniref:RNA polymerase sigma-70 factor n=1 Tax=unclassified Butyricimonas TaxID=2637652 RepID=UPI000C069DD6|nr:MULTISPECIES: RNA polymerase sigma-70 factor [unclassified Butyricimonas]